MVATELGEVKTIKGGEAECISDTKSGITLYQNFNQNENILYIMRGDEVIFEVEARRIEDSEYVLVDYEVKNG